MTDTSEHQHRTRRGVLQVAAAGLAGLVGLSLGKPTDAQATDSSSLIVGQDNGSATTTSITSTTSTAGKGVLEVTGTNADYGLKSTGSGIGVYGSGPIGVYGDGSVGGVFSGTDASISLQPRGTTGAPTGSNLKGDIALDSAGVLWLCIADGSPGTWIRISHGGTRLLPAPVRAYSSTDPGAGGSLTRQETRRIPIVGVVPGLPLAALAIVANVTIHSTQSGGYVTAFPWGVARPPTSTLNWNVTGQSIANAATVALGDGSIAVFADATVPDGTAATEVIVDVAGYIL